MRGFDLRALQARLSAWGLSSLGRGEPHVLDNLDRILHLLQGIALTGIPQQVPQVPLQRSRARCLDTNTHTLFGDSDPRRKTRIMVTLPAEAADNPELVDSLVANGMDCARINCAHDDSGAWARMITNVRLSAQNRGRNCKILMDLGGHKIRTGPLAAGPAVMYIKPRVMLNKGPYIVQALRALDNVLLRMQDHQYKKNPLLRALQLANAQIDEKGGSEKPFSKDTA
jgi:pyruvate kinase